MKVDVLLGLQWGDEGKGKIVDFIANDYKVVARFQGGPNAGHTLEIGNIKHVLHQIPSGIFHTHITNVIGNGVVLDPIVLKKEIDKLNDLGIDANKVLKISKKANLIIPTHKMLDAASEKSKGDNKIGSTLKGIGPTYQDKVARQGLRFGDLFSGDFKKKYTDLVEKHKSILSFYNYEYTEITGEKEFFEALEYVKTLSFVDSEYLLNDTLNANGRILAEGAQGAMLDIDFGSYPFVTSSNTMISGACSGLGVAPSKIGKVIGIFKAYCTRVGGGPFPTELLNQDGEDLRKAGNEFGSTTGRPRRCGWLDLPALKYAIMINGVTELVMMKSDVLNIFEEVKICTQYKLKDGSAINTLPFDLQEDVAEPVLKTMKGWKSDLRDCDKFEQLPTAFQDYVLYLEKELNLPISIISTGPKRDQTIFR
jgi:adenylosuccinate synthase